MTETILMHSTSREGSDLHRSTRRLSLRSSLVHVEPTHQLTEHSLRCTTLDLGPVRLGVSTTSALVDTIGIQTKLDVLMIRIDVALEAGNPVTESEPGCCGYDFDSDCDVSDSTAVETCSTARCC